MDFLFFLCDEHAFTVRDPPFFMWFEVNWNLQALLWRNNLLVKKRLKYEL